MSSMVVGHACDFSCLCATHMTLMAPGNAYAFHGGRQRIWFATAVGNAYDSHGGVQRKWFSWWSATHVVFVVRNAFHFDGDWQRA